MQIFQHLHPLQRLVNQGGAMSLNDFVDTEDAIPWRLAFPEFAGNEKGVALAGARGKEGLTQKQLSEKTGIPQRHISEMENGKRAIGKKNAKLFAEALNIDYRIFL